MIQTLANTLVTKTEPFTRFSRYLLLVMAVFTCTFFIYRDFGLRMILGYGLLCLIWGIHMLRRFGLGHPLELTAVKGAFFCLCATVLLSFLRPDVRLADDTAAYLIAMCIGAAFLLAAQPAERELRWTLGVMEISALFFCVFVLFFETFQDLFWVTVAPLLSQTAYDYLVEFLPKGYSINLGGISFTDYVVFFAIAVGCGKLLAQRKWDRRCTVTCGLMAIAFFVLLVSGRRGELLAAMAACCLLYIAMGKGRKKLWRLLFFIGLAIVGLALLILVLPLFKDVDLLRRYVTTVENLLAGRDITAGRLELYALALERFGESPLFGIGWGRYADYVTPSFKALHGDTVADVHNIYLQFLCETGIVGTIFLVVPMVYIYVQTFRQVARLRERRGESCTIDMAIRCNGASFAMQSFFLTLGMLDPCFTKYIFWSFYALAVLLASAALTLEGRTPTLHWPRKKGKTP